MRGTVLIFFDAGVNLFGYRRLKRSRVIIPLSSPSALVHNALAFVDGVLFP